MGARGRVSSLSLVSSSIEAGKRPDPPKTLEPEAAEEWRKVVADMPAGWFPAETHAVLEDRCRQVVWLRHTSNAIASLIKKRTYSVKEYNSLMKLAMVQSRTLVTLDTKMRLTQQSSYDSTKRKHTAKGSKKPWAALEEE